MAKKKALNGAKQPPKKPRKQPYTVAQIEEKAKLLEDAAKEIRAFAQVLRDSGYGEPLVVDGGQMINNGLEYVPDWLGRLRAEFDKAKMRGEVDM